MILRVRRTAKKRRPGSESTEYYADDVCKLLVCCRAAPLMILQVRRTAKKRRPGHAGVSLGKPQRKRFPCMIQSSRLTWTASASPSGRV
jgi:hypothetical protein